MKKPNEVFIPGALPDSTYITRMMESGFTYEERLKQALNVSGYLTLISGLKYQAQICWVHPKCGHKSE